ncbi:Transcriptional activator of fatty acid utilization [Collariella sp. IMI 366227]|nr:Transcriptional activator of fatty acid utilization [Collariella sp. IMI 366227]
MDIDMTPPADSTPPKQLSTSPSQQGLGPGGATSTTTTAGAMSFRSERGEDDRSPLPAGQTTFPSGIRPPAVYHTHEGTPSQANIEAEQQKKEEFDNATLANYMDLVMKPKFTRAPITEAGRVAYLGESSNLTLLVHDRQSDGDVVHYPLPDNIRGSRARLTELDNIEIDILHQRGAFLLPPRALCDELVDSYFKWIHPIVPVINKTKFLRRYKDPKNPPSLLLLQAMLLAGSRVCSNPQLMDANGSSTPAALTFYKRAKALYDANYEDDRVTIVQSLLLMGWYWEGPEDVTKNVFYWTSVASTVAQGSGMHRSVEGSQLTKSDKRLWKRIWWSLFTRDRSVAVALGRPCHINLDDSDVEMLTEDDFNEDEPDSPSEYPPDPVHVQFFLQYVKLCEIMGLVLSQQYSVASKGRRNNPIDLTHSDMALADWLQHCPKIVYWEMPRHHFWSALLHSNYYTTLCLLHRAHMPPSGSHRFPDEHVYPSRNIAFQAAAMVTSIIENLSARGELRYCPAFVVYSLFSALIMHVYQMRSPVPSIQQVTQDRIRTCMSALKEVSRGWLVGKMVHTLFESILGNKVLEERLQKAAGKRHRKAQQSLSQLEQHRYAQEQKRKYDEMAIDFSAIWENFQPDQLFPENAHIPLFQQQQFSPAQGHQSLDHHMMAQMQQQQQQQQQQQGANMQGPPPPSAFGQQMPKREDMGASPLQGHATILQPGMAGAAGGFPPPPGGAANQQGGGAVGGGGNAWHGFEVSPHAQQQAGAADGQSPSDSWSTSSVQGQPVPSTLNVEDW